MMSYNYSGMHSVVGPEVSKVTDIGHSAQRFLSRKDTALADIAGIVYLVQLAGHCRSKLSGGIYDTMDRAGISS